MTLFLLAAYGFACAAVYHVCPARFRWVVLLAVSVFGYFGGIVGMLLAVPLAGIIQIFVLKWVHRREVKLIQKRNSGKGKIPPIMD